LLSPAIKAGASTLKGRAPILKGAGSKAYAQNADGWPRILSRLKTLLETGKTFKPH
jgi:hypothetical protein